MNGRDGDPALGDQSGWASVRPSTHNGGTGEGPNLEEFVAAGGSLADHLTEQLHLSVTDPAERLIGVHLIHMVDEAGYLQGSLDEVATKLGAPESLVAKVLATLQGFDPPGVFARDLAECLALQLKDLNRYDPQIAKLLDNLPLLGSHNLAALKRAVGVDADELVEMITEIKRLNPKPGLKFGSVQIQPVLPDVIVRPGRNGGWSVELNNDTLPRVLVNRSYYSDRYQNHAVRRGQGLSARLPAERQLAGQKPRPARTHDPARGRGDRAPAGRLPDLRHRAPEAAQSAHGGGRHFHARIRRSAASRPTSTCRRRAACSS